MKICGRCGGDGQLFCWEDKFPEIGAETYSVLCEDCDNEGPVRPSEKEANEAWNELQHSAGGDS